MFMQNGENRKPHFRSQNIISILMFRFETSWAIIEKKQEVIFAMKTRFYEYLTRVRNLRGYTQAQMAEKLGYHVLLIRIMKEATDHQIWKPWSISAMFWDVL